MYFEDQSRGLILELNKILENFQNKKVCLIDVSAGNGRFLNFFCDKLNLNLKRENRHEIAEACFNFLPMRATLDLAGWSEDDIFSHT